MRIEPGRLYELEALGNDFIAEDVGLHEGDGFDFHISTMMALILGAPFALGALAALWITAKFFIDFGKRPYTGVS